MNKLSLLMLSLLTLPTYAQGILSSLNNHQSTLSGPETSENAAPEVTPSSAEVSSSSQKCEEDDQTSLPLAYVTSLIQKKDPQLEIIHDPRSGSLRVKAPDMISNCSSMLEWKLKQPSIQGQMAYAIEVKIKEGQDCSSEGCSYKVARVENGEFKQHDTMVLKPTLKGFEECLKKSGVVTDGKVIPGAIYSSPVNEKFTGIGASGKLLFLSHGPSTPLVKAKYGNFEHIDTCDYYEIAHPTARSLLTLEDAERERLDAEAAKLRECKVEEYSKLADFIEKYERYADELGQVRDRLILEAAQKSAKAIEDGTYTEDDLKLISDFHKYIVKPKAEYAVALVEQMEDLEGDAWKEANAKLNAVRSELQKLSTTPYFTHTQTEKLLKAGRFEEATNLNSALVVLDNYKNIGRKIANVDHTPELVAQKVATAEENFSNNVESEKENYQIRTGQVTGNYEKYASLAQRMRDNIKIRTENFNQEILLEIQRMRQPNGYCYRYWRNTQNCIKDSLERVQELQALLQHYNSVDLARAAEYDAQAKAYGELEAEGRRYLAVQNGEPVPADVPATAAVDTTVPTPRTQPQDPMAMYNLQGGQTRDQMQQYQGTMAQGYNQFMQQNPYGYNQQPAPYLGQQNYATNSPYGYVPQQNPYIFQNPYGGYQSTNQQSIYGNYQQYPQGNYGQQQGYWNNPFQAYNQFSIYGRTW